jgi:hypothetical protein
MVHRCGDVLDRMSSTASATAPDTAADPRAADRARARWDAWRTARARQVAGPLGPLTLVETTWLPDGAEPDLDAVRAGRSGSVTVTALERTEADTGGPEHGYRIWDAESAAVQAFVGIEAFPYDPAWVLPGEFRPVAEDRLVPYEHLRDGAGVTRDLVVPGDVAVTIGGEEHLLAGFADGDALIVVFADPTNGSDDDAVRTYGTGRFLVVRRSRDSDAVVVDLNRAYIPPCGFSDQFNCPLPPRQNRLGVPVTAGERFVRTSSPAN